MKLRPFYFIFGLVLVMAGLWWLRKESSRPVQEISPADVVVKTPAANERRPSASASKVASSAVTPSTANAQAVSNQASELYASSSWKLVPETSALPQSQVPTSEKLKQVSGYVLVATQSSTSQERNFYVGRPLVYFNSRTSSYGVMTGTLRIKLKSNEALDEILRAYQLRIADSFPHLKTFMIVSEVSPFDLVSLVEKLRRDPDVQEIEPELLTRNFEKN